MNTVVLDTLAKLLDQRPELLEARAKIAVLRAVGHPLLLSLKGRDLRCFQSFRLEYERLLNLGFSTEPYLSGEYDAVIYLPTGQRDENLYNYASAVKCLKPQGLLLCAMSNEFGAARFAKRLQELLGEVESFSKYHCRVFWGFKSDAVDQTLLAEWLDLGEPKGVPGTELLSRPGIFGWNKIDIGSALLVQHLPLELPGRGADLGCGYGFLSEHVLRNVAKITELHLYEAEKLALDVAAKNLEGRFATPITFEWHDVPNGIKHSELDWIVMNPPFHVGKTPAMGLGSRFIKIASQSLRERGELYMVANAQLPYPEVLRAAFSKVEVIAADRGFKAYKATK